MDALHFHAPCEVHDGESVEVRELDENSTGRSIWVCLESHGSHAVLEFHDPTHLICLEIDNGGSFVFNRPADCKLSIRSDVEVVDTTVDRNALCFGECVGVDNVNEAWLHSDADEQSVPIRADRYIVWAIRERDFL